MALQTGKEGEEVTNGLSAEKLKLETNDKLIEMVLNLAGQALEQKEVRNLSDGANMTSMSEIANFFKKEKDYQNGIRAEEIPADDYLEEPVVFTVPAAGYLISGDMRQGFQVKLPFGKPFIFFEFHANKRFWSGGSKEEQIMPFAKYVSHSKAEVKFLKEHSLFNVEFYESFTLVKDNDMQRLKKMSKIMNGVRAMDPPNLIKACKAHGVQITSDYEIMRSQVTQRMVEKEIASERISAKSEADRVFKEQELLINAGNFRS